MISGGQMDKTKEPKSGRPLDEVDYRLIQAIVARPGVTDTELETVVELRRQRINVRRNNPQFRRALAEHMKPAAKVVSEAQPEAARVLRGLLRDPDAHVQAKSAIALLKPVLGPDEKITIKLEMAQKVAVQISEVINKYVHDPAVRRKIADDLRRLGS